MKRKVRVFEPSGESLSKRRAVSPIDNRFRPGLFAPRVLEQYTEAYRVSEPYKHGVIQDLLEPLLLRAVRTEIQTNISFTPKETDIYKIHQSGDLANLDGLDNTSLSLLPSLVKLRDAMYSKPFRDYLSHITGSGALSGSKTDMAVNVYTPSCHLLCHDDVIGSRRVSYILYLTDPDRPWKAEWGGALRLYPTEKMQEKDGADMKVPSACFTKVIPPSFNQLSFFAVQPGESFHDVEEVYAPPTLADEQEDGGRVRMAISGWYHIPQEGEEGYDEGAQERQAERSSLAQLQGKADKYDLPQIMWRDPGDHEGTTAEDIELDEEDLSFLLEFMNPRYLTPETVDELAETFGEESSVNLGMFLNAKYAEQVRSVTETLDVDPESAELWHVARPPHKHRFMYLGLGRLEKSKYPRTLPIWNLVSKYFHSLPFRKWLSLATGLSLTKCNVLARRFRRGLDYTLATSYDQPEPQLEVCLGLTPSAGWGDDNLDAVVGVGEDASESEKEDEHAVNGGIKETANGTTNGAKRDNMPHAPDEPLQDSGGVGGYEVYMAGDEDADDSGSDHGVSIPSSHTGAGKRREKADPAVYKAGGDEEDDGILMTNPACWNTLSIVLRDQGTLKFVKYVSKSARGDRWDVVGEWKVKPDPDS